ncbi:MAG: protein kinase, partial [Thermoanaerobaculia bacterium]|nr:protein kinase [Thermoanaerobaculia bacterium]
QDAERLARFEREAKLLAQLHHPNIASIFGLEESDGTRALVMELVEGPTLAERLESGALPFNECLSVSLQIAQALEEAHEKGIVHRDLKPQNVKAPIEGKVKVLDFGLAKAMDPAGVASGAASASQLAQSPTLTLGATQMGVILGTAAYMAPEQAAGGSADRRADVWAFGVVLYEMLTGRRLFEGETVSHVLASVLKDTPDFSALPPQTPERIRNLLRRCLRKKSRERLQAIGDARVVIEEVLAEPERDAPRDAAASAPAAASSRLPWLVAAVAAAAAVALGALWLRSPRDAGRGVHAAIVAPDGTGLGGSFALSPDGARLAFQIYDEEGRAALWLRDLASGEAKRLAGTEGGEMPFWAPDGRQLAFFSDGKLRRLDPNTGAPQVVCEALTPRGATWGEDGRIVFAPAFRAGLSIVPAAGGVPQPLTTLDEARREKSHRFPVFLPGGERLLFLAQTAEGGTHDDASAIEALDLATGERTRLVATNSSPLYATSGHLLYWREGTLFAHRFDADRLALLGEPAAIAAGVGYDQNEQVLATVAGGGTLVYQASSRGLLSNLGWLDRRGIDTDPIRDREQFTDFALSHDGRRLAYAMNREGQGSTDLWIHDLERGVAQRLTFEEGSEFGPVWSPDDRTLYYSNDAKNDGWVYRRTVDGGGEPEAVGTTDQGIWTLDVAPDESWLVLAGVGSGTNQDVLRFDLATKRIEPLVATPFMDSMAQLSPDGSLLAYASEESGRWEIYVQALAGARGRWQISSQGGVAPRWRGDGRELFFVADPDRMMAVTVEPAVSPGAPPRFSAPVELFRRPLAGYDVAPDGQRFVGQVVDSGGDRPLTLITHWTARLPQR